MTWKYDPAVAAVIATLDGRGLLDGVSEDLHDEIGHAVVQAAITEVAEED